MRAEPTTTLERVVPLLDGARLVVDQPGLRRFAVWSGGEEVLVLDRRTGVVIERFLTESSPTEESVRTLIEYRTRMGY